jgi:F-type H+-transporting ATPase subunit b
MESLTMTTERFFGGLLPLGEGGFNPTDIKDPNSLWMWLLVVFLLTLLILTKFAWKPLMKTIEEREKRISDDIEQAAAARKEAEEAAAKHRAQLEEQAQEAKKILDEARTRAEALGEQLKAEARADIQAERERATKEIEAEKRSALEGIKEQVVQLSIAINEQLALERGSPEDHVRQAESLMARIERRD